MSTGLSVRLSADTSAYDKALVRARDAATRHAGDIAKAFANSGTAINTALSGLAALPGGMAAISGAARAAATAFIAFEAGKVALSALTAAAEAAGHAVEELARVGAQSQRLGVSSDFYQAWTQSAHKLNVETKDLTDSLERAHRAFTQVQGSGTTENPGRNSSPFEDRLRAQIGAGNATSAQLASFQRAATDEDRLRAALEVMRDVYSAGRQLAALNLADSLFPASLVDQLRSGRVSFEALLKAATDLKAPDLVIVKAEDVARAQELERRLKDAQATLDRVGAEFNQELARAGMSLKEDAIAWKETVAAGANILLQAYRAAKGLAAPGPSTSSLGEMLREIRVEKAKAGQSVNDDPDRARALDTLRGSLTPTNVARAQAQSVADANLLRPDKTAPLVTDRPARATAPSTPSVDQVESFTRSLERQVATLKAEADAFGKSTAEKQAAIAVARAKELADQNDIQLTDERIAKIEATGRAYGQARDRLADLEQQQRQAAEAARFFGGALSDSLADAITEGRSFGDILKDLEKSLVRMALRGLITGEGPLAGLLGTAAKASEGGTSVGGLFGFLSKLGGFAGGGHVNGPGTGTSDSIVARLSAGEFVVNAAATSRHRAVLEAINSGRMPAFATGGLVGASAPTFGGAPGSQVITLAPSVTVNATGGTPAQNRDLAEQTAKQMESVMRSIVVSEIQHQQKPGNLLKP